ncbi:hypothetical protein EHR_12845 [Enterococcus hirae ATCC 9790]|uniref:Uncharacterized protein n=1 Tax=Enterococcus hirae (strain ATCC 9790 / DSM 20160 / JCM 8729 / LMG 6399 / NBRC 3181 / NCIMB 6459 / NCDO 1258 / NCTC 12367 / WDCM 00089 / R) TaxID=768486 RepID=I6TD94_ENTHA|nr:hypothetical protein EHR_12845 [Enterococcus hirae ATCC 9790]
MIDQTSKLAKMLALMFFVVFSKPLFLKNKKESQAF